MSESVFLKRKNKQLFSYIFVYQKHRRTLEIAILNLYQTFWEFTHRNIEFESPAITIGRGGVTKIAVEKIGNVNRVLKKTLKVWTRQVAQPSCQTSSRST